MQSTTMRTGEIRPADDAEERGATLMNDKNERRQKTRAG